MEAKKWARTVVISGAPQALTDDHIVVVALLRKHFFRQQGYMGSHLLVDKVNGVIRSTGFWETRDDLDRSDPRARSLGKRMCQSIWGDTGSVEVEVSEVLGLDPPTVTIAQTEAYGAL